MRLLYHYFLLSLLLINARFSAAQTPDTSKLRVDNNQKHGEYEANRNRPKILTFTASPTILHLGQEIELSWQTQHAISVGILPHIGRVKSSGAITLSPSRSITYTLIATGWDSIVKRRLDISVLPSSEILTPPPPMLRKKGDKIVLHIKFRTNHSTLPESSYADLNDLIGDLGHNPKLVVQIVGHTDRKGNEKFNTKLSLERAVAVQTYFIKKGIDPKRLFVSGAGSSKPLVENSSLPNRLKNRRIEITVLND